MADIFVSYASEDKDRVAPIAEALIARGWSVWWDMKIAPGTTFRTEILRELSQSRCVLVLWSKKSVDKQWVLDEAEEGQGRGVLVPAMLDNDARIPFGFKGLQAAKLEGWTPSTPNAAFAALLEAISKLVPRIERTLDDRAWKRLLARIKEGYVIPVVGRRLLVSLDGRSSLMHGAAAALLKSHGIDPNLWQLQPFRELHDAITVLKQQSQFKVSLTDELYDEVYKQLKTLVREIETKTPEPLRQLSGITDFKLFITTTPDDFCERSIAESRPVCISAFSPRLPTSETRDLSIDWRDEDCVQVLYLFGKARPYPIFAIDDYEIAEYLRMLIRQGHLLLPEFFKTFNMHTLLFIGCDFPELLLRTLIRTLSAEGLSNNLASIPIPDKAGAFVSDRHGVIEKMIWDGPAETFVTELRRRWDAALTLSSEEFSGRMFCISFSREDDEQSAQAFVQELSKLGVADKEIVLLPVSSFEPVDTSDVTNTILHSRYFIPLISKVGSTRGFLELVKHWDLALAQTVTVRSEYIIPVIVDQKFVYKEYTASTDNLFYDITPEHAPGGELTDTSRRRFVSLIREARRPRD
ncbi:MAG: toll/interleukin-1 receptor domain-containing protein [Nitrospira sp. BO4]|jgi:hypothetical protein|nr:toll/interleukin-1 receptor domain-containing protein [Nitrospira sp. BO4]